MVDSFTAESNRFRVVRSDKTAFDTAAPSFQIFNTGRIQDTIDVVFPDLFSNLFYFSNTASGDRTYCESWSSLMPQEWGPDEPNVSPGVSSTASIQRTLPRLTLGSVPAGTNHLNIRVRLRQTKTPPSFYSDEPPRVYAPYNQWITLIGGSCTCEGLGTNIKRHFDVVLSGTTLYLDRYQSVSNIGYAFTSSSNPGNRGWITNQPNQGAASGAYDNAPFGMGVHVVLLDQKGPNTDGTKFAPGAPNSSNPCSTASNLDYESIFSVDFDIQPGRYL